MSFSAQYQQNPLPAEGNVIKREWLRYYDAAPEDFDVTLASWELRIHNRGDQRLLCRHPLGPQGQ
jgi:hypothetical protein